MDIATAATLPTAGLTALRVIRDILDALVSVCFLNRAGATVLEARNVQRGTVCCNGVTTPGFDPALWKGFVQVGFQLRSS